MFDFVDKRAEFCPLVSPRLFLGPRCFQYPCECFVVKRTEFCPFVPPRLFLGPRCFQYPCVCVCCQKDRTLTIFLSEALSGPQVLSVPMCLFLLSNGQNSVHFSLRGYFWAPGVIKTHVFVFVVKRTEFCPRFSPRLLLGPRCFQDPCVGCCCQKDRILSIFLSDAVSGPQVFSRPMCLLLLPKGQNSINFSLRSCFFVLLRAEKKPQSP